MISWFYSKKYQMNREMIHFFVIRDDILKILQYSKFNFKKLFKILGKKWVFRLLKISNAECKNRTFVSQWNYGSR